MDTLSRVRKSARAMESARADRDAAIMQARAEGATWRVISEASGLSIQGLLKLMNRNTHTAK